MGERKGLVWGGSGVEGGSSRGVEGLILCARALEYRLAGWSYREIAIELGISLRYAKYLVSRGIRDYFRRVEENAGELVRLELMRLDTLFRGVWPKACQGDLEGISVALKIMDRRARLLGLDVESQLQVQQTNVLAKIGEMIFGSRSASSSLLSENEREASRSLPYPDESLEAERLEAELEAKPEEELEEEELEEKVLEEKEFEEAEFGEEEFEEAEFGEEEFGEEEFEEAEFEEAGFGEEEFEEVELEESEGL